MKSRSACLAALLPSLFIFPVQAETESRLEPLVVTATRFDDAAAGAAANVVVIDRESINRSGATTLPDVLRNVAGVLVRPLYGSIGADTAIDMRGFGDGGSQRTLVLLNGQRLNPLDLSSVDWGLVPLDSVERVEVISGSGAILYGDNAVGGVINIITAPRKEGGSVLLGGGSRDSRQAAANLYRRLGAFDLALGANRQTTDGWRDNNRQERSSANARLGFNFQRGEAFVDLNWSELDAGLPGALTEARYRANPRQAETPDSKARRTVALVRPGVAWQISDNLSLAAEVAFGDIGNEGWYSNFSYFDDRRTDTLSFTPRLRWQHGLGDLTSVTTLGVDYYAGELESRQASSPHGAVNKVVRLDQTSRGLYFQNRTELNRDVSLTLGVRRQTLDQTARDSTGARRANDHAQSVGEAGVSVRIVPSLRVFSRVGRTFRFANLDELTTFGGFVSEDLRPERGRFVDIGGQWSGSRHTLKVTAYRLSMEDEIAFNNFTFQNENLARTRHRGIEANGSVDLDAHWQLSGGVNAQSAVFRDGVDKGNRIPLVPSWQANTGLHFQPVAEWRFTLLAQHVGERHFGGDTANARARLPAYTVTDFVVAWQHADWTLRARINNLSDRRYAPTGYDFGFGASYYPADGRSFFADLRYAF